MNTPIKIDEYFFPVVQVVADPSAEDKEQELDYKIEVSLSHDKEKKFYQVAIEITSIQDDKAQQYAINVVVIGIFRVDKRFKDIKKMLYINGASMLYSAAREFLITITSRGPWGAVTLPTHSFLEQFKKEAKNMTNKTKKTSKKSSKK